MDFWDSVGAELIFSIPSTATYRADLGTHHRQTVLPWGAGVEFGFNDNATLIRADFTSTSLTLTDLCELAGGCHDASVHLVFTASTPGFFSNFQGVGGINDFPGTKNASVTGAGDTLTLDWGGADPVAFNVTFDANFTFGSTSATPLPATLPLFAGGAGLIGLLARRRKQKRAA